MTSLEVSGYKANYFDKETGDEHWVRRQNGTALTASILKQ